MKLPYLLLGCILGFGIAQVILGYLSIVEASKIEFRDYINNVYPDDVSSMLYRVGRPFPPHHSHKIEATQTKADVVGMIAKKSIEAQIDPILSLRIAFKESSYNPIAKNKVSSAKGLYMFIDKTWKSYCTGDVYNAEDNLTCFLKLYPKHPDWWVKP